MIEWERIQGGKANLKRWVLSFDRNVETDNELRVSGGREFQNLGAMTEKAFLPRDVRTYEMDGTDDSCYYNSLSPLCLVGNLPSWLKPQCIGSDWFLVGY